MHAGYSAEPSPRHEKKKKATGKKDKEEGRLHICFEEELISHYVEKVWQVMSIGTSVLLHIRRQRPARRTKGRTNRRKEQQREINLTRE